MSSSSSSSSAGNTSSSAAAGSQAQAQQQPQTQQQQQQQRQIITVHEKDKPPKRLEGGGFTIVDILSKWGYGATDPFLIWHELPHKYMKPGEMPGAPMHPHRGFNEVPYCKVMQNSEGSRYKRRVAGKTEEGGMTEGDLEWGMCANGIEHEFKNVDGWHGELHMFQLWVNLPNANRRDAPEFQNATKEALPKFQYLDNVSIKLLVGEFGGRKSPVVPRHSEIIYMEVEVGPGGQKGSDFTMPIELERVFVYVYRGSCSLSGSKATAGEVYLMSPGIVGGVGTQLCLSEVSNDLGFMLLQGKAFNEPSVQYGPFVMGSRAELQTAFEDFQMGRLTAKPATFKRYEKENN